MNIGIIGAGNMGSGLGKIWADKGHKVMLSYKRNRKKLETIADSIGSGALVGTPQEAAQFGEVILLSVSWAQVREALQEAGSLTGKILIDCTMPLTPDLSGLAIGHTTSGSEEIAKLVPQASVVRAFNTTFAEVLHSESRMFCSQRASILYCGDDAATKTVVAKLILDVGFEPVDAGALMNSRYVEPLVMQWMQLAYVLGMGPYIGMKLLYR